MSKINVLLTSIVLLVPVFSFAQVQSAPQPTPSAVQAAAAVTATQSNTAAADSDLHTTIMNAVMQDPRAATLPPAQLQEMINTLENAAKKQGISAETIRQTSGLQSQDTFAQQPVEAINCEGLMRLSCAANQTFGFDGSNLTYTFYLWVLAGICFMLLAVFELRLHRGEWHFLTHHDDGTLKK